MRTCCQLVVEQQRRLPTQLAAEQAAGLHREGVVVAQQQAADAEVRLGGVPQAGRLVGHAVVHVHLVALGTARGGTSADRQHILREELTEPMISMLGLAHPALVVALLSDRQALPEEEDVVFLRQDLQRLGSGQRNCRERRVPTSMA